MVIKNIVESIDKSQFDMHIFCIESPLGPWGEALKKDGVPISTRARQPGFDVSLIKSIRRYINQHNIHIVHCHQYTPWVYGTFASIGTKAKVIFTEHGRFYPDSKSIKRRFVNPVLRLLTAKITAISDATANALDEYEYIPIKYVETIYNGIDDKLPEIQHDIRKQLNFGENTVVFGTIARFDPIKNHMMMLDGFASLVEQNQDVHLIMVGDGECRAEIEAKIKALQIDAHVTLTGYIARPFDYLEAMDVFLLTSFSEGTSMTLLEAMRASKPCIVTDVGGNPEVIKDGESGVVIASNDVSGLSSAMFRIAANFDYRQSLSEGAQNRFQLKFTSSIMCQAFQRIYSSLINREIS